MSGVGVGGQLVSIYPEELVFEVELEKQSHCNIKVINKSEHHVAFKVKTTSPKKYFVRPNTSVVQPWDSCTITVTLQPQKELPPDLQCSDKFLVQCTKVPPMNEVDALPPDTFNKEGDKVIEEMKLKVVYAPAGQSGLEKSDDDSTLGSSASRKRGVDGKTLKVLDSSMIITCFLPLHAVFQEFKHGRDANNTALEGGKGCHFTKYYPATAGTGVSEEAQKQENRCWFFFDVRRICWTDGGSSWLHIEAHIILSPAAEILIQSCSPLRCPCFPPKGE